MKSSVFAMTELSRPLSSMYLAISFRNMKEWVPSQMSFRFTSSPYLLEEARNAFTPESLGIAEKTSDRHALVTWATRRRSGWPGDDTSPSANQGYRTQRK